MQAELSQQPARTPKISKWRESDAAALSRLLKSASTPARCSPTQEQADVLYRTEAIKFNMLLTSGQNRDGEPGDEGLAVMLIPVDMHGDLVKLAGEVELDLFDMTLAADEQCLGRWRFTIDEVRSKWQSGLLSTGYLFQVDWQRPPAARELTLHARLTIPDGRKFDVTSQVKVEPPVLSSGPWRASQSAVSRGPSSPVAGKPAPQLVAPSSATVKTRRPNFAVAGGDSKTPNVRPAPSSSPTRTSDNWTDDTIPVVR